MNAFTSRHRPMQEWPSSEAAPECGVDIVTDPDPAAFRRDYIERSRPCVIRLAPERRPPQFSWTFERLAELAGDHDVMAYDWGDQGPTVEDDFRIVTMKFRDVLQFAQQVRDRNNQRYAICQLPLETCPPLERDFRDAEFLADAIDTRGKALPAPFSERRRDALFISFFRGIHWHNGRDALAQIGEGGKRFILFSPQDTPHLYPKRFSQSPLAWFDETEAVFCSEIPFENGLDVDLDRFPKFARANPIVADVRAGEALYIPSHWWHFTMAHVPSVVTVTFWDAPLRRWQFPLAWRSVLMKPYRKFLFPRLRRRGVFTRTVRS